MGRTIISSSRRFGIEKDGSVIRVQKVKIEGLMTRMKSEPGGICQKSIETRQNVIGVSPLVVPGKWATFGFEGREVMGRYSFIESI